MSVITGAAAVDLWRRSDENGLYLVDYAQPNLIYYGITPLQNTSTLAPKWQIKRLSLQGTLRRVDYANGQKYNNIWDNRSTYFPPVPDNGERLPEYEEAFPSSGSSVSILSQRTAKVTVNNTTWTNLLAGFTNYNVVSVRNKTGVNCVVNGDNAVIGVLGYPIDDQEELNYNEVSDSFVLYAKSTGANVDLDVEVLRTIA